MCLSTIEERHRPTQQRPGKGFKVFRVVGDCSLNGIFNPILISKNGWTVDPSRHIIVINYAGWSDDKYMEYDSGFHLFDTLNGAKSYKAYLEDFDSALVLPLSEESYRIHAVEYDEVTARGQQNFVVYGHERSYLTIVAKKLKVGEACA